MWPLTYAVDALHSCLKKHMPTAPELTLSGPKHKHRLRTGPFLHFHHDKQIHSTKNTFYRRHILKIMNTDENNEQVQPISTISDPLRSNVLDDRGRSTDRP